MARKIELDLALLARSADVLLSDRDVDNRNMRPLVRLGYVSMRMTKFGVRTYRATVKGKKLLAAQAGAIAQGSVQ
jgi:hypothetical protein